MQIVTDQAKIASLTQSVARLKGWHRVLDTYPGGDRIFLLDSSGKRICFIDIGANWVGCSCGSKGDDWPPLTVVEPTLIRAMRADLERAEK